MLYVTRDGDVLHDDRDFEGHQNLETPVDVEELEGTGVITTGIIQMFDDKMVRINDHTFNRFGHVFISRPHYSPEFE